jgi:hypothetical protein
MIQAWCSQRSHWCSECMFRTPLNSPNVQYGPNSLFLILTSSHLHCTFVLGFRHRNKVGPQTVGETLDEPQAPPPIVCPQVPPPSVCSSVYQSHTSGENESDYETEVDGRHHRDGFRGGGGPNAGFRNPPPPHTHARTLQIWCPVLVPLLSGKDVVFSYVSRENLARGML